MGVFESYLCKDCQTTWNAEVGDGEQGKVFYCKECGKEYYVDHGQLPPGKCTCGGELQSFPLVCPCCGSKNIIAEEEIGYWE